MNLPTIQGIARAYLMAIFFWCGFALLMGLQYRPLHRHNFWPTLFGLLVEVALRGLALAFWTPPIFYLVRKYLNLSSSRLRYVLLWSLGAFAFILLHTTILWVLVPPYDDVLQRYGLRSFHSWIDMIRNGFADQIFIYIAIVVAAHAYEYLKRLRTEEREKYEFQQALVASELQALKMQLHPHFLFNTLQGIAALVDGDPQTAEAMIVKLSTLLRTALDRDTSDLIPLEDELRFTKEYLELEMMRFGNRLAVEWLVAPEAARLLVPQMILQPLIENAIVHGISSTREAGWIKVVANIVRGVLKIHVHNNGAHEKSNGTGIGLRNAKERLKYLYSGDASLEFSVAEKHTATVTLTLPALHSQIAGARYSKATLNEKDTLCASSSSMTNL